jgi:hypothetical protein
VRLLSADTCLESPEERRGSGTGLRNAGGIVEIVSCPKCGHPRALGRRCPSCGDPATIASEPATVPAENQSETWQAEPISWKEAPGPDEVRRGQGLTTRPEQSARGRRRWGLLASAIVAVVVIAIVAVVVVALGSGESAVLQEQAAVASAPDTANDQAAESLLRNAVTAMDAALLETTDYTTISQSTLETMEPSIDWVPGRAGACTSPAVSATVQDNAVTWACTGLMTYEIGTWSASGVEFGVQVNRMSGVLAYYRDGKPATW